MTWPPVHISRGLKLGMPVMAGLFTVFNLLPVPSFDGGRILSALFRRPPCRPAPPEPQASTGAESASG